MARIKKFNLPKYLRLAKGLMWMDIEGDNCSNVKLYRNMEQFVGRGNDINGFEVKGINKKTHKDEREYKSDRYPEYYSEVKKNKKFEPKKDIYKNKNSEHGEFGFVEMEDKAWFCTEDIPHENLGKIITAYQNSILVKHNPKKEYKQIEVLKQKKNFVIKEDGDIVFNGTNTQMYNILNKHDVSKIIDYIKTAGMSSKQNLMDLYQYELKGYNKISRPRAEILDLVRDKLRKLGPGMSAITKNDLD